MARASDLSLLNLHPSEGPLTCDTIYRTHRLQPEEVSYNTMVAPRPNRTLANGMRISVALALGVVAFFVAYGYGDEAPLGAALPEVPVLIEHEGIEVGDSSFLDGRLNERMLELMAPQADGFPPLVRPYTSKSAGFTIGHPYGTVLRVFLRDEFQKDNVLSQAYFSFGIPLTALKYSLPPMQEGEQVTVYVSRVRHELDVQGVEFLAPQAVVQLENYRFETLQYKRQTDQGKQQVHFAFFGPFYPRVLVIDFITTPQLRESAIPLIKKIIESFEPGAKLLGLLEESGQARSLQPGEGTEPLSQSGEEVEKDVLAEAP